MVIHDVIIKNLFHAKLTTGFLSHYLFPRSFHLGFAARTLWSGAKSPFYQSPNTTIKLIIKNAFSTFVSTPSPSSPVPPSSLESLLSQDSLVISRQYEMLNIFFGYEQHNRYLIASQQGTPLGYILEENGFWRALMRQILRGHRPLKALIVDTQGQLLLDIRRPWTFINSRLSVLDCHGHRMGEVHQLWHLWRRKYELFVGKNQIASIDAGFLSWDFPLLSQENNTIALITRNFTHLIREMFTDAGEYVVLFRDPAIQSDSSSSLSLTQKAVTLGCAISVDFDYFSRHSQSGWNLPIPFFFPTAGQTHQEGQQATESGNIGAPEERSPPPVMNSSTTESINSANQEKGPESNWPFALPWLAHLGSRQGHTPDPSSNNSSSSLQHGSSVPSSSSSFVPDEVENNHQKNGWFTNEEEDEDLDDGW